MRKSLVFQRWPNLENEYFKLPEDEEEGLLRYYFFRGFEYKEIHLLPRAAQHLNKPKHPETTNQKVRSKEKMTGL